MPSFSVDGHEESGPSRDSSPSRDTQTPSLSSRGNQVNSSDPQRSLFNFNFPPSVATIASPPSGIFCFGQALNPASTIATSPVPSFRFGEAANSPPASGTFSFRSIQNVSPQPSPQPLAQTPPLQSLPLSSAEAELSRLALSEGFRSSQNHAGVLQPLPVHISLSTTNTFPPPDPGTVPNNTLFDQGTPDAPRVDSKPKIVPYNVRDEQPPPHPFFTNEFQTALENGLEIAKGIADMIQSMPDSIVQGREIRILLKDAQNMGKFIGSDTRTIAVLGNSGEGSYYPCRSSFELVEP